MTSLKVMLVLMLGLGGCGKPHSFIERNGLRYQDEDQYIFYQKEIYDCKASGRIPFISGYAPDYVVAHVECYK